MISLLVRSKPAEIMELDPGVAGAQTELWNGLRSTHELWSAKTLSRAAWEPEVTNNLGMLVAGDLLASAAAPGVLGCDGGEALGSNTALSTASRARATNSCNRV